MQLNTPLTIPFTIHLLYRTIPLPILKINPKLTPKGSSYGASYGDSYVDSLGDTFRGCVRFLQAKSGAIHSTIHFTIDLIRGWFSAFWRWMFGKSGGDFFAILETCFCQMEGQVSG